MVCISLKYLKASDKFIRIIKVYNGSERSQKTNLSNKMKTIIGEITIFLTA